MSKTAAGNSTRLPRGFYWLISAQFCPGLADHSLPRATAC